MSRIVAFVVTQVCPVGAACSVRAPACVATTRKRYCDISTATRALESATRHPSPLGVHLPRELNQLCPAVMEAFVNCDELLAKEARMVVTELKDPSDGKRFEVSF